MAKQKEPATRRAPARRGGARSGSFGTFCLGAFLGVVLTCGGAVAYLYLGNSPIAATDRPAPWERPLRRLPLRTRLAAEAKGPPFAASEDVFEAASRTYRAQCSQCHGSPGHESAMGRAMAPHAQQFFSVRDRRSTAAQSPGELFWKTAFGLRRSGMPAYNHALTETQIWQTSLLLHSAADDLPDPVRALLTAPDPR